MEIEVLYLVCVLSFFFSLLHLLKRCLYKEAAVTFH